LGVSFRWLLASSWVASLGDGFALSAGPLLLASETRDASLVALATLLQRLPWLLFAVFAGALADRWNRTAMVVVADLLRSLALVALAALILTGMVDVALVLAVMFVLGIAEVFSDTASSTLLPSIVGRDDLALANARMQTGFVTLYQLAGPPVGAALFVAGRSFPFLGQAVLVSIGVLLVARVRLPARQQPVVARGVRTEVAEGFRWVRHNPAVRTLALTIFTFNITFGAAWSILVLYARERLGLGAVGFGLLTTAAAVGGILGTISYGWITRRVSLGNVMRVGLIIETFTHLSLALTTTPAVALAIMVVFGAHAFVWGATSATVRQRAVPEALQGRGSSVIADYWGITAPFWFAFVGSALFVVVMWRQLTNIAHQDGTPTVLN
jgi:MFS family permease